MMQQVREIYWLAGLLEGEGWFSMTNGYVQIGVKMTDLDTIMRARDIMNPGGHIQVYKANPPRQAQYALSLYGVTAAQWMMTIYPLMGVRRKARIAQLLQHWRSQRKGGKAPHPSRTPRFMLVEL